MFSSLAAYLFGNTSGDTETPSTSEGIAAVPNSNNLENLDPENDVKLKVVPVEVEEEDQEEWLIVDKDEEESLPRTDSEEEIPFVEIKKQRPGSSRHRRVGSSGSALSTNSDGIPSLAQGISQYGISTASCMGESWLVTPPPCFTSTGPIDMVTSPFENLLIEHPSMSVYHRIRSSRDNPIDNDTSLTDYQLSLQYILQPEHGQQQEEIVVEMPPHPAAEHSPVRTARVVVSRRAERIQTLSQKQSKEIALVRDAQKINEKKTRQVLSRGALKRGNKVRDFNSKGGRPRRADLQHCKILSGANNNRKC
ncbi:unnamed protein product [Hermetia illucens]|uniref:Tumor protein p53-inducible nuclear protein 1 n=1 Tax=Hermetia illucens TaxID=343691 RepID=A0A7R8UKS7_HERIL|nr:tumor protein p53-inducible nuclear protein 1 [Hermetia illucens]XP_037904213.1 tumor protein p53-inducible nuclear protein 1 [Hermetia illucens]CAD7082655.1 unnamed protein product [Hermetia illucens]